MPGTLQADAVQSPRDALRRLTLPIAALVAALVTAAWYVTWATADLTMAFMGVPLSSEIALALPLAFLLLVVMMAAMMLPSALPMVLTYAGITRLENGRPVRPADRVATAAFAAAYFVVWGVFALAALVGLIFLGVMGPVEGILLFVPAVTLVAAGAYQVTRTKEACLRACVSPMGFVMTHWRNGRRGAWRMGLDHAAYCIGCCWLFMLVLFVAGAMSLAWMGAISLAIFAEKLGWRPVLVSRVIGLLLLAAGILFAYRALTMI